MKKIRKFHAFLDKKAWLRIVEAFFAILIVTGAILVILQRQGSSADISEVVYERQRQVLDIVSKNESLRDSILIEDTLTVDNAISQMIPGSWNYSTNICDISLICSNPVEVYDKDVYSTEVVITSNLTQYSPKKLSFFVWVE